MRDRDKVKSVPGGEVGYKRKGKRRDTEASMDNIFPLSVQQVARS